jgi:hypothetical protein
MEHFQSYCQEIRPSSIIKSKHYRTGQYTE